MQAPMSVLSASTKRETGKKAQLGNITAAKAVADIIRTTLGPRSMLKMLLDATGGIVLTNDGNAILREIDVSHPAAKSVIELSRTQDEEVGDGTTSVIILAGEMLHIAEPFLERHLHPTVIIRGYVKALEDAIEVIDKLAFRIDTNDKEQMMKIVNSCIGTKFTSRFGTLLPSLALDAVLRVKVVHEGSEPEIDIKKYAKVEKVPGGSLNDCKVLDGVMFQKDVVLPGRMRRKIENPRIMLLDCPLEYKKGENQTNVELTKEEDWAALLKLEEDWIQETCAEIAKHKPDVVITEKGLSDLAMHYLSKANISAIRRLRKTDNNRIARATGATIVHRPEEIKDTDIGTGAGLFEVQKIGDEFYCFIVACKEPKACTILLRGASKDVLNEVERNLQDAMGVARNVCLDPRLVPGGGAVEMAVSHSLAQSATSVKGNEQGPYAAVGEALEVIPRTLAQNCGANVIRTLTKLRAKHADPANNTYGINGNTGIGPQGGFGCHEYNASLHNNSPKSSLLSQQSAIYAGEIVDMKVLGVWEPYVVKTQTIKTAIESATVLLRIDDIVSGIQKKNKPGPGQTPGPQVDDPDQVDSEQMLQDLGQIP